MTSDSTHESRPFDLKVNLDTVKWNMALMFSDLLIQEMCIICILCAGRLYTNDKNLRTVVHTLVALSGQVVYSLVPIRIIGEVVVHYGSGVVCGT